MRVVAHQQIQAAQLGVGGGAEVLEQLLGLAGAVSGGLAQRGGERLRAGRVASPVAGAQRLAEQGQREGALARARGTGDHYGRLTVIGGEEPVDLAEDGLLILGQSERIGVCERAGRDIEQRGRRGARG